MSYAMTKKQIKDRTKTVTRRDGWENLKVGEIYCAVEKGMGLKKGEKVQRLAVLQCVGNRRERLYKMIEDKEYGSAECILEGFPELSPLEFVQMYTKAKKGRHAGDLVSRIEFRYLLPTVTKIDIQNRICFFPNWEPPYSVIPSNFEYMNDGTLACRTFSLFSCDHIIYPSEIKQYQYEKNKIFSWLDATFRFEPTSIFSEEAPWSL